MYRSRERRYIANKPKNKPSWRPLFTPNAFGADLLHIIYIANCNDRSTFYFYKNYTSSKALRLPSCSVIKSTYLSLSQSCVVGSRCIVCYLAHQQFSQARRIIFFVKYPLYVGCWLGQRTCNTVAKYLRRWHHCIPHVICNRMMLVPIYIGLYLETIAIHCNK